MVSQESGKQGVSEDDAVSSHKPVLEDMTRPRGLGPVKLGLRHGLMASLHLTSSILLADVIQPGLIRLHQTQPIGEIAVGPALSSVP